jgi:hypothetical protein
LLDGNDTQCTGMRRLSTSMERNARFM